MQYYSLYYSLYYGILQTPVQLKQYIIIGVRVMFGINRIEKPDIYSEVFYP